MAPAEAASAVESPAPEVAEGDRERARRTRPEAASAGLGGRAPVDPGLWLLHVRYERRRTPELAAALVEEYTAYAYSLARRAFRRREPLEDLRQVAMVALLVALERFECERSLPFTAFASPTIIGALKRHHRDQGWALRVPRAAHTVAVALPEVEARLDRRLGAGRSTRAEVAAELGLDVAALDRARAALRGRVTLSIDTPASSDSPSTFEIPEPEDGYSRAESRVDLARALDVLSPRDRAVVTQYFFEGRSQVQIADTLGVSQMQVSRTLASALARLRARMDVDEVVRGPSTR